MPAHLNYRRFLFETPNTDPECLEWIELLVGNNLEFQLHDDPATVEIGAGGQKLFRPHEIEAVRQALHMIHNSGLESPTGYMMYCILVRDLSDKPVEELQLYRPGDCDDNLLAAILTVNDPSGDFYGLSREDLLSLFHSEIAK
jgi:hypothetical protein